LVRISACHAEGRRFESGPDRYLKNKSLANTAFVRLFCFRGTVWGTVFILLLACDAS
jgi:hypothetical protein